MPGPGSSACPEPFIDPNGKNHKGGPYTAIIEERSQGRKNATKRREVSKKTEKRDGQKVRIVGTSRKFLSRGGGGKRSMALLGGTTTFVRAEQNTPKYNMGCNLQPDIQAFLDNF